ncbi:MAG: RluA family pseudouridine synthase [Verrucomicrobiota bacterium]
MVSLFEILHEDADLLVLRKPAGLVCHPTKGDEYSSLVSRVRIHLGFEPHMIHRLDRETGGVMVFAKTDEAGADLRALWAAGLVTKEYVALVRGRMPEGDGFIDAPLGREVSSAVAIKDCVRADGASARTRWRCEGYFDRRDGAHSRVRVWLDTGRKHQIRIHLAHLGHPIVGDKLYGGDERIYLDFVGGHLSDAQREFLQLPFHALHAERLWFPWKGLELGFDAGPESWFVDFAAGREVPWFEDPFAPPPGSRGSRSAGSGPVVPGSDAQEG